MCVYACISACMCAVSFCMCCKMTYTNDDRVYVCVFEIKRGSERASECESEIECESERERKRESESESERVCVSEEGELELEEKSICYSKLSIQAQHYRPAVYLPVCPKLLHHTTNH